MERKDIQTELYKLTKGMDSNNIYSQLTYFMVELSLSKENTINSGYDLATIIGLLSDSYFGQVVFKKNN